MLDALKTRVVVATVLENLRNSFIIHKKIYLHVFSLFIVPFFDLNCKLIKLIERKNFFAT